MEKSKIVSIEDRSTGKHFIFIISTDSEKRFQEIKRIRKCSFQYLISLGQFAHSLEKIISKKGGLSHDDVFIASHEIPRPFRGSHYDNLLEDLSNIWFYRDKLRKCLESPLSDEIFCSEFPEDRIVSETYQEEPEIHIKRVAYG